MQVFTRCSNYCRWSQCCGRLSGFVVLSRVMSFHRETEKQKQSKNQGTKTPTATEKTQKQPAWQACFWSLHFVRCAKALQAAMYAKFQHWSYPHTNSICGGNLDGEVRIYVSSFSCLWPSLWQAEAKAVQTPPWPLSWLKCTWQTRHSSLTLKQRSKC